MSEHISAHQLSTWIRCPKQYEFRYLLGYRLPPRGVMTRGSACHKAWEADYRHKIQTRTNLPIQDVLDVYDTQFEELAQQTEWERGEERGELKDIGVKMVASYHEEVSQHVQPVACEEAFEIQIGEHRVRGVIDLETDQHEIRDAKTTTRRRMEIPLDHQLQMTIYSRAKPQAKKFILDHTIATEKTVQTESVSLGAKDLPQKKLDSYLEAFGDSLRKGSFPPTHPMNWWCSEKWCGFYKICKFGMGNR